MEKHIVTDTRLEAKMVMTVEITVPQLRFYLETNMKGRPNMYLMTIFTSFDNVIKVYVRDADAMRKLAITRLI